MEVLTIRIQEQVAKQLLRLAKEMKKPQAEVVRTLMNKAVQEEHLHFLLRKYEQKQITLRGLAKELGLPLWKVHDLLRSISFPYKQEDLQRDLQLVEGL
jgi:antitoxin component of RelBE/YafQ-DinJ toxin-antitoxin module